MRTGRFSKKLKLRRQWMKKKKRKHAKKKEIRLKRQTGTSPLRPYRLDFGLYPEDNEKLLNVFFN